MNISIVMATFNGERFLPAQLKSISLQSVLPHEMVICDDQSEDTTWAILEDFRQSAPFKVFTHRNRERLGSLKNFEKGLSLCTGELILLSDQDDIFVKDKIASLLKALNECPDADLVISDLKLIDSEGQCMSESMWRYQAMSPKAGHPFFELLYKNFATGCTMLMRRRLIEMALPIPPGFPFHDWWLALVASSSNAGGIILVTDPLVLYRQHGQNQVGAQAHVQTHMSEFMKRTTARKALEYLIKGRRRYLESLEPQLNYHAERVSAMLNSPVWSDREREGIDKLRTTLDRWANDDSISWLRKILEIPQRIRYTIRTGGSYLQVINLLWFTLNPFKS